MKNKILKIAFAFILFSAIFITSSFAAPVKEDAKDYTQGAYIIGSTRFEPDVIITASLAANAGINEAKVNIALGNDISDLKVAIYSYDSDFEEWNEVKEDGTTRLLEETEAEELEENLNIFFVNNEVKSVEVKFQGNVDKDSLPSNVEYDQEKGIFIVPATTFNFTFTETKVVNGEEVVIANEVSTNVDKNVTSGTEKEPVVEEPSKSYAAKVGSKYFEDLHSAIEKATGEDEVILLADVDLKTAVVVSKKVTLNLNGKTLTAKTDTVGDGIFTVITGGDLTINGEGTIDSACQTNDYSMAIWAKETGKVTINGGTFTNKGAKDTEDDGDANNNELIYARHNAQVVINGGTFIGNTDNKAYGARYTLNLKDAENETSSIIVKGGTFTGYNPANSASENPRMNFLAEGYKVVKKQIENSSEFEYTVAKIEEKDVAISDGIAFTDLQTAVNSAAKVKLLKDIDLKTAVIVTTKVTLELNGKTLTAKTDTVGDGIFTVVTGGDLTINGEGTIDSACQTNDYSMAIWAKETGKVTINGGTFTNKGAKDTEDDGDANNNELIYARHNAQVVINGGTFIGNTDNKAYGARYTLNLKDAENETSSIIVKGGTFTGYNPANSASENPRMNFLAEGYKSVVDGDTYKVLPYDANNVTHEAELRAVIAKGGTVKLGGNIELVEGLEITNTVILELNGKTLSANKAMKSLALIKVTGGNLTINGEGTVNSASQGNDYSMAVWATGEGIVTINGGAYTNVGAKSVEDNGTTPNNNELIYANGSGKIYINGGTFTGNTENAKWGTRYTLNLRDQDNKVATIVVKGGTFTAYDPANSKSENPTANLVAEGYESIEENGIYTVSKKAN